tara:strand:+ start:674 stop:1144 length:471 start_codon:yes stop_codon:yes gene_type:complete
MKLSDKINKKTIIYPLNSQDREDALHELLNHFQNNKYLKETKKLFLYLNSDQFKTMARRGVAYHYHTSLEVKETLAVLGISVDGINYQSTDGLPCNFILLILEPMKNPNSHRKFINMFQEFIRTSNIKSVLLKAESNNDVEKIIFEWETNNRNLDI